MAANIEVINQKRKERLIRFVPYIAGGIIFIILPVLLPSYFQSLMSKVIIFALFAMSLDLVFGYTGLLSLGHAAYFGVGGYTAGILMVKYGISSFWIGAPSAILMATLTAAVFGPIALRVSGVYFLLVTLALGQLLYSITDRWYDMTGGTYGLGNIARPDLGLSWFTWNSTNFYYFILLVFVICYFLMYRIKDSPFGRALQGIRENEPRMEAIGYNTWLHKYIVFIIGALFAGVAGLLFAYHASLIGPTHCGFATSGLAMLIVIIGTAGTLWGSIVGSSVVICVEYFSSIYVPERWPMILGATFVITVMFLRGGIGAQLQKLWEKVSFGSSKNRQSM